MFSQASVSPQWGSYMASGGCAWQRGMCVAGAGGGGRCVAGETATAADGTLPTGMLSCINHLYLTRLVPIKL